MKALKWGHWCDLKNCHFLKNWSIKLYKDYPSGVRMPMKKTHHVIIRTYIPDRYDYGI